MLQWLQSLRIALSKLKPIAVMDSENKTKAVDASDLKEERRRFSISKKIEWMRGHAVLFKDNTINIYTGRRILIFSYN
ncbi:hypothetical protein Mapa_017791 [Marchantia paleacea]|nr:hypothetical protein Mapa_017791 [Marchantia paleacea]